MSEPPLALLRTQVAVFHSAMLVQEAWIVLAESREVADVYLRGLRQRSSLVYPAHGEPLAAAVVNVAPGAARLEEGSPALHLPSVITWPSPRSRVSKKGTYFLIIPFRHGTPRVQPRKNPLPRRIYAVARQLQAGQRLTAGPSHGSALHAPGLVPYEPRNPRNRRPGTRASIYEGLRRMADPRGAGNYATFRTMTPTSPGWHLPARPGLALAREVVSQMTPEVTRLLETAMRQDLEAAIRQRLRR